MFLGSFVFQCFFFLPGGGGGIETFLLVVF